MTQPIDNMGFWNIMGANSLEKLLEAKNLIICNKLHLLLIVETKLNYSTIISAASHVNNLWHFLHNLSQAPFDGLLILCKPNNFNVDPLIVRTQLIHSKITHLPSAKLSIWLLFMLKTEKHIGKSFLIYSHPFHFILPLDLCWWLELHAVIKMTKKVVSLFLFGTLNL